MAEENERHVGDELADSKEHLQQIQDAAQQSKELREKIQNKRNSNKEKNGEGSNKESSPDSKKTGGKSGAEEAGKAGKNGANSAKEAASAGPQSAAGGASSAIPGMNKLKTALRIARKIANAIRKLIKAIIKLFVSLFTGPTVLSIILVIILSLFPLLILKSMVTELFVQVTRGYFEVYDAIFGFDDVEIDGEIKKWDDLTSEEKRKYCEGKVNDWFGEAASRIEKKLAEGAKLLHKFFQFLDDITSDDTAFGGWVNKISNDTYEYSVAHDAMELMEELDKQGVQYDQTSLTAMMVMAELQEKYDKLDHMITSADFDEETNELYQEYINTYTQVNTDLFQYENDNPARSRWMYFENMMGYQTSYNTFEVYNIPIVIEGVDNFVTMDGKTLGTISEDGTKQYLNDSITYNPYGNKIDNLSLSLGSDYQLIAAASYIMACYSASTPYEDQSVANLLTMMNDAFNRTGTWSGDNNRQDIDDLCEYHFKFTEVYMGAVVPRLYQPYLYETKTENGETQYIKGNKRTANTALNLKGGGSVIGMEPTDTSLYESSKLLVPTGWYDVNYDEIWTQDEELPICLQSLDTTNYGTFYNDSFCIISPDERYNSFNPSPYTGFKVVEKEDEVSDPENPDAPETPDTEENEENPNEAITVEDVRNARLGYFIYGSNSEEYKDLVPYSNIDFGREFERQYQQQQALVSTLSETEKTNYVYRYQFPFTRISTSFADEDESDFENPNNITVNYRRTTPLTADASGNIEFFGLDTMNHAGATYTLDENGNPVSLATFSQESSNHGVFNGYEAWVYLDDETQSRVAMMPKNYVEGNQQILDSINAENANLSHMTIDLWDTDTMGVPTNAYFENKPYLYQAKMRYMISVNVTVIPRYMDFIMDCIGYDPTAPLSRGMTDSKGNEISTTSRKGHVTTQGEVATGTYEAYMTFLGVREEELAGASPQVGTFPVIPYEDMMNILRNCKNADETKPTMNQLQLVYVACAAAGHVMYQFGGDQPAGLNFDAWQIPIPEDSEKHDARNRQPYEYYGMDCSGFVSWIYKTAYNSEFARFDTAGAIQFSSDCNTTTQLRMQIKNGSSHSTSYLGEIFIDKNKLRVGDIAVRRTYNKDQVLSGHVAMYCGEDPDDPSKQLWIEMTRFGEAPDPQQSGIQLFTNSDYGYNRNAVYIATHTMLPESDLPWDDMSPVYMMIPSKRELGHEDAVFQAEVASLNPFDDFSALDDKEKKEMGIGYDLSGMVIVLDPGHQAHANNDTEPLAPWSSEPKAKVSAGTKGVATGRPEYEVVLEIALKAKAYLEANGATVYLTRSTNDVNISNIERANFAMEHNADVFIRLHCDESEKSTSRGIGVFVCSAGGDGAVRKQREYGGWLGDCLSKSTGSTFRGVTATTTYSGLNWCENIPSFLLEMGFMSNAEDDKLLSDPEYQIKICRGIVAFCVKMKEQAT